MFAIDILVAHVYVKQDVNAKLEMVEMTPCRQSLIFHAFEEL